MKREIIVKNQQNLDKIKSEFEGTIYIEGGDYYNPIVLKEKFEYAHVVCRGQAVIIMRENSQVNEMWENSQVNEMRGEAMVSAYGINSINCFGYNIVRVHNSNKKNLSLIMNKESHLIVIPDFKPTFSDYSKRYPVKLKDKKTAILYKAVHKRDEKYVSDYDTSFVYEIGKKITHNCNKSTSYSCTIGLHISHLNWAKNFGDGWEDLAILECEVPINKIIVAKDCDGKVRTSELTVIREVSKEELK